MQKVKTQSIVDETCVKHYNWQNLLVKESSFLTKSTTFLFTTDISDETLLAPESGKKLILNAITILGDGDVGNVKILRGKDNTVILPCYFAKFGKSMVSCAFNFKLDIGESVKATTSDRGTNETFIGISYLEQ